MKPSIWVPVCALVLVFTAAPASALQLSPMSKVFSPSGAGATQSFELSNPGSERVAVVMSTVSLARDQDYVETNSDAGDDFLIYPSQVILGPGARQTVRVSWLGRARLERELTYRIVAEQVPIEVLARGEPAPAPLAGKVRVMTTFRGTLFIRPSKAAPRVSIAGVAAVQRDGASMLALTLQNDGTAAALVKQCTGQIVAGGQTLELTAAELGIVKKTRVLAGTRRRYLVPWPKVLPAQPPSVTGRCDLEK